MNEAVLEYLESIGCEVLHEIEVHSSSWYNFREEYEGSGGSEVGSILGINKWQSPFETFHYHARIVQRPNISNEPMMWGTLIEPLIRDIWTKTDPTNIGEYVNRTEPIRNIYDINKYIINPDYKHFYASPDGIIPAGEKRYGYDEQGKIVEVGVLEKPGILEIKKLSSYSIKEYGGKFPESYKAQVQTYMMLTGTDYCEMIGLVDGSKIIMEIVEADKDYQDMIFKTVNSHWNRVLKVREMLSTVDAKIQATRKNTDILNVNQLNEEAGEIMKEIEEYFPPVDNSESVALFMSANYLSTNSTIRQTATDIDKAYVRRWNLLNVVIKKLKAEVQFVKNNLEVKLFNSGNKFMTLGEGEGEIKMQARGKATLFSLYNYSKKVGDEDKVSDEMLIRMNVYLDENNGKA